MNTSMNMQSQTYDARKALGGYLERTDLLLARSGLSRSERDETLGQIVEQFYDLLGVPIGEADQELTEIAIAKLAPERMFELNDTMTTSQLSRAVWNRFCIGGIVPIFLNDRGHKRVVWGELIKMLVWLGLLLAMVVTFLNMMMLGGPSWRWIASGIMFGCIQLGLWFRFTWLYHHTPVEALPRAEDWPAPRLHKIRYMWILTVVGPAVLIIALFPTAYWLIAAILSRPAWPIDNGLFVIVAVPLGVLLYVLSMWSALQRRRNTRRFYNWDRHINP